MNYQDTKIVCRDCEADFAFSAREQQDFARRGFKEPTRCPACHERRSSRRKYSRGGETVVHTAPCSTCGKEARLPFKPIDDKPVYCTECYQAQQEKPDRKRFALRDSEKPTVRQAQGDEQTQSAAQPQEAPTADAVDNDTFKQFRLDPRLNRAIHEAGYVTPTPVQAATIPIALMGGDLIGTAQTGTGKTAAFVLPILEHLLSKPVASPRTRVIVLTPTRELAEQISECFKALAKHTRIRTATIYGGVGMIPQEDALRKGVEVIVACPGRLLDHIERGNTDLRHVEKLVLDEADRMLDMGFLPPIKRILARLPRERHSMLFSATFAPELNDLVAGTLKDPKRVDVDLYAPAKTVAHALYPCPQHLKTALVLKLLDQTDTNSVLIFTRTKHRANRVAEKIGESGYATAALHSNRSQNQRQLALDDFRGGKCQVLVATDIAARGIDVQSISHVINYDIPENADMYIHRIGRTGRAEREGDAMTLVTGLDAGIVFDIEKALGGPIERIKLEDFDYTTAAPARDPFKRGPAPSRRPRAAEPVTAAVKTPERSPGYFATQRKYRSKKAEG